MDSTEIVAPAPTTPPGRRTGRGIGRWPWGIVAIAIVRLVDVAGLILIAANVRDVPIGELPIIAANPELTRAIGLVLAVLAVIGLVGLLALQRWGWVLTMVLVGLSLLVDLIRVALGQPPYLALLLHMIAAFYLNGRAVRALCHVAPDDAGGIHDELPADAVEAAR